MRKNEVNSKKNERGFVDETGSFRYTMTIDELESIYKRLEDFVAIYFVFSHCLFF